MPFFVIKKGLVLLEWKYFPTPKILDPNKFTYGLLMCTPKVRLFIQVEILGFFYLFLKLFRYSIGDNQDRFFLIRRLL